MTPHNEHIMLKLAREQQHEHNRAADALSRAAWAWPRRKLALAAGLAGTAAVVAVLVVAMWPF
jgi:hypothetical protein